MLTTSEFESRFPLPLFEGPDKKKFLKVLKENPALLFELLHSLERFTALYLFNKSENRVNCSIEEDLFYGVNELNFKILSAADAHD